MENDFHGFSWLLLLKVACTQVQVLKTVGLGDLHIILQILQPREDLMSKKH